MKSIEKRIEHLEKAYRPGLKTGAYWPEVVFIGEFEKRWPDRNAAPKFALAAYDEIMKRRYRGQAE